jgi:sensor histidine kinase YesM
VDTIINYKCALGQKEGITFHTSIFIPMKLLIKEKDLCIILSNALDNAIEAARLCEAEKTVDISIASRKNALSIVIKNSYFNEMKKDALGNIFTTKVDASNHGLGLSSIRKAVNKYDGEIVIELDNNIFCLMILLELQVN